MSIKTEFIIVRVSPELKKKALKRAKEQKVTLSNWARNLIEDGTVK